MEVANRSLQDINAKLAGYYAANAMELSRCKINEEVRKHELARTDPSSIRVLSARAQMAEAQLAEMDSRTNEAERRCEKMTHQCMQLQAQLAESQRRERLAMNELERRTNEFNASRLALLIKCARANHERTCMERDALGLREWAVDMLGADSLDPREEPGWDDAFAEASVIEAREVANRYYGRSTDNDDD